MSVQDLVGFLQSPEPQVSTIALENLLPSTPAAAGKAFIFKENDFRGVRALKKLSLESTDPWTIQNSIIALINLTGADDQIRSEIASDAVAVKAYAKLAASATNEKQVTYACMLLNNLAREPETLQALKGALLMALVLTTAKPENIDQPNYDFLVLSFSEFAREDPKAIAKLLPYLYAQLTSKSDNRRKAVAATIKNALFDVELHDALAQDTPLIESIMICLMGPESLDNEDFEQLPPTVRREYSTTKQREADEDVQILLIECFLLLSSSQIGRDTLRAKNAYFIIRELHKSVQNETIFELSEKFVNMVMRGDPSQAEEPKVQEIQEDDEDEGVTEVI